MQKFPRLSATYGRDLARKELLNPRVNLNERIHPVIGSCHEMSRESYQTLWKRSLSPKNRPIRNFGMTIPLPKNNNSIENIYALSRADLQETLPGSSVMDPRFFDLRTRIAKQTNSLRQPQLHEYFSIGKLLGAGIEGEVRIGYPVNKSEPSQRTSFENNHGFRGQKLIRLQSIEQIHSQKKSNAFAQKFCGKIAAVKTVQKGHANQEVENLKALEKFGHHPNIPKFYHLFESPIRSHILTELLSGGDLFTVMSDRDFQPLLPQHVAEIMLKVLVAVKHMNNCGLTHLDIKLENIMRRDPLNLCDVVLIDFGHSSRKLKGTLVRPVGSPSYSAPEVMLHNKFSVASDIWSLGVVMHLLMVGILAYPHLQSKNWREYSNLDYGVELDGDYIQENDPFSDMYDNDWTDVHPAAKDLCKRMLNFDADKRISIDEALQHPWFAHHELGVVLREGLPVVVHMPAKAKFSVFG